MFVIEIILSIIFIFDIRDEFRIETLEDEATTIAYKTGRLPLHNDLTFYCNIPGVSQTIDDRIITIYFLRKPNPDLLMYNNEVLSDIYLV